jgi:hypothetical protein
MTARESSTALRLSRVDITAWRLDELLRAGYSWDDGFTLALREDVDLRLATRLLGDGCPPETALRILL